MLSAFFAATITPDNKVLFEMHRVSILNTLLKEYSYIGIDKAVSKYYLSVFNGDKTFLTGTENENIMDPCEFCWYEWELCPEETFTTTKDSTAINNVSVPHDPPPHCWIEHCETECMPGGGGGNGGGGGGGCPTCPPPPQCDDPLWYSFVPEEDPCEPPPPGGQDTILNPCNQILLLQNNQGFKDMLQILKNHADNPNDTTEHGFVYNYLPNNLSVDAYDGIPGEKHIDLKFEGMTGDGTAHNHFINSLSIFSPQDLWGIATIFNEKLMADSSTFTMALVTASNTQYLMMIENITKFRHWAQRITIGNLEVYKRLYTFIYKISETNTIADNELRFLKFLKDDSGGTGLKLFRGNANFAQWTPLMLDGNNNVITGTCQ
ncbi:MAG: hypothetical protein IT255_03345 [Chitinophagaceae bacterium]|nr:hypothetical protein [Chitinophagaceae bacterium]